MRVCQATFLPFDGRGKPQRLAKNFFVEDIINELLVLQIEDTVYDVWNIFIRPSKGNVLLDFRPIGVRSEGN
jgi:hypothetical protein